MNSVLPMHLSPRCSARSKRTGERCRAPAVTGWTVCRFDGAGGGRPKGKRNGNYKHGLFTNKGAQMRRTPLALLQSLNDRDAPQCRLARLIASERVPTTMRPKTHVASRLNQLRDTNLRPK